ncbi:MAG TPA: hypothetical protein VKD65_17480, partial [Candidatus Angelobacter sp.]|nr:hypothetical protein [Candidatus Angelobacter sp.]
FYNPAGQKNVGSDVNFVCWNGTAVTIASSATCGGAAGANVVGYVAKNPNAQYIKGATGMVTNLGRNTYIMPGINTANLSLFKNMRVKEKVNMQFRIEMFNAFNHPSYTLGSGNFTGQISTTSPAQSTSGYVTPGSPQFLNKAVFSGGMGNAPFQRVIQWGMKLMF